ncbi:EscU/YscU/HrcU family type III secretion system export apparatus switch protein [Alteromonas sp. 1_MG-2023]|uniref:EscU/YscU/HrcU family type III secretion system export apparatus switch protein n=1 Tax=unclassified Alteromonas TaxID=2614992 RepID=UPI0026E35E88|nr:EscU/YscU/HrcU family type III secretion system export apparatus switch protein [Alteromonas sp. 1_MG-2023]MDO6476594.1 EscU/YscU/HrcU family type III secretion system export apparatus switch protein [Alteromonas sp. 1_MG-2023]
MSDKTRKAIGLRYNSGEAGAKPKVVSKGYGELAGEIIRAAEDSGILIHEDPYLSDLLATLDLGQEIPESLYYVIAELIAWSYVLQGKMPEGWENSGQLPQRV